ncbi:hypothetical protein BZA77DRAFT_62930 [Pyronema omphalodes]|nr:hypothetical protein BZA77DRAFT_62930 [Pyronema omphalodes]
MDPLSISAAVSGFLSLAGQIATTLKDYIDGVKAAPGEVQSLHLEVMAFSEVLGSFMGFMKADHLHGRNLESSCVLLIAVQACKDRLEELHRKLADIAEACSKKTLPDWITRMKWPLKKEDVQQTIVSLQRFAHIFQFSMVIKNYELMSKTSSAVLLQLEASQQEKANIISALESMSIPVHENLQKQMTEISEIKTLVTELAQLNIKEVNNISLGVSDIQDRLQDMEIQQIMPLISQLEPYKRHQDIRQQRLEGTGNWFLLQPVFQKWSASDSQDVNIDAVLACTGHPGAGKSVICSLVFDHLQKQCSSEKRACVACLYFDYQYDMNQTPANIVGVLLKQVIFQLNKSRLLHADTISKLKDHLNAQKTIDLQEGCELLGETIRQLRRFYICIDALDECNERARGEFIQALAEISSKCSQPSSLRIFFTTRPHIKWEELMKRNPGIGSLGHIFLKAHPEDIRIYIAHEIDVDENNDCMDQELRTEILDTTVANSDGMFLLAALQIQTVLDETTISRRRKALHNMPRKLETAFESTITRIKNQKSQRSKQAMDILKWTFLARRPLTVTELRHALSITVDTEKLQDGQMPHSPDETIDWKDFPSEKSLIDWCLGLIVIDEETSTVRLVHKSLHDHLTQLHEAGAIFPNGHTEIAYTCLRYMRFNDDQPEIDSLGPEIPHDLQARRRKRFCFLGYAIDNFGHHLQDQSACTAAMINGLFPDVINRNRISTGLRSIFLSPFNRCRWLWPHCIDMGIRERT